MKLYEQFLQEGSKKRFIDNVWNKLNPNKNLPESEEIIKWVDSGAAVTVSI